MPNDSTTVYKGVSFEAIGDPTNITLTTEVDANGDLVAWTSGETMDLVHRLDKVRESSNWMTEAKTLRLFPFGGIEVTGGPDGNGLGGEIQFNRRGVGGFPKRGVDGVFESNLRGKLPIGRQTEVVETIHGIIYTDRPDVLRFGFLPQFITDELGNENENSDVVFPGRYAFGSQGHILRAAPFQLGFREGGDTPAADCAYVFAYATTIPIPGLKAPPFFGPNPGEAWRIQQANFTNSDIFDGNPDFTQAQGSVDAVTGQLLGVPAEWRLFAEINGVDVDAVYRIEISKGGCWPESGTNEQDVGCYEPVC